jgi:hypothetical protein
LINATAGNITATLPSLPGTPSIAGRTYTIKRTDMPSYTPTVTPGTEPIVTSTTATSPLVTIQPASGSIDGQSAIYLPTQYAYVQLTTDGTNWYATGAWSPPVTIFYSPGDTGFTAVTCPQGMRATGGGCYCLGTDNSPYQGFLTSGAYTGTSPTAFTIPGGSTAASGASNLINTYQCNEYPGQGSCNGNTAEVACGFSIF